LISVINSLTHVLFLPLGSILLPPIFHLLPSQLLLLCSLFPIIFPDALLLLPYLLLLSPLLSSFSLAPLIVRAFLLRPLEKQVLFSVSTLSLVPAFQASFLVEAPHMDCAFHPE